MILEIYFIKYLLLLDTQPWKNLLDDYAMGLSYKCWYIHFYHYKINTINTQGFFSKFLMGGTQNFQSATGTKSDGGWTCEKNLTEAKTAHLMQN